MGETGAVTRTHHLRAAACGPGSAASSSAQGLVWRGPAGWAEWSPFLDYAGDELVPWLRAADEAAEQGWPAPVRDRGARQLHRPGRRARAGAPRWRSPPAAGPPRSRSPSAGQTLADDLARLRGGAGRPRSRGPAPGRRQRRLGPRRRRSAPSGPSTASTSSTSSSPAPRSRSWPTLRRRLARAGHRRAGRRGRVDPAGRGPLPGRALEAADVAVLKVQPLGGVRACLRGRRADRAARRRVQRARDLRRHPRPGWRWPPRCPSCRSPAGWTPSGCWPTTSSTEPLVAVDGMLPVAALEVRRRALERHRAPADVDAAWQARLAADPGAGASRGPVVAEATQLARALVEGLLGAGVRDVVLAPGSRSAPLAYELFEADRIGLLRAARADRRAQRRLPRARPGQGVRAARRGRHHLGHGRGQPAPRRAGGVPRHVPLVAADAPTGRPAMHPHRGQPDHRPDPPVRPPRPGVRGAQRRHGGPRRRRRRRLALRAGPAARPRRPGVRTRQPGPVHLDVALHRAAGARPGGPLPAGPELVRRRRATGRPPLVLPDGPQTVLVAGDLPPAAGRAAAELAAAAGVPLLAEPSSNARRGPAALGTYRLLLGSSPGRGRRAGRRARPPDAVPAGQPAARPHRRRAGGGLRPRRLARPRPYRVRRRRTR